VKKYRPLPDGDVRNYSEKTDYYTGIFLFHNLKKYYWYGNLLFSQLWLWTQILFQWYLSERLISKFWIHFTRYVKLFWYCTLLPH